MFANFQVYLGRLFFQRIGLSIFLCFVIVGPLLSTIFLFIQQQNLNELTEQQTSIVKRAKLAFERKERGEKFIQKHLNADPYFLDKEIESFPFLAGEKDRLSSWLVHPAIANKENILKRLQFIENDENRISFTEDDIESSKFCIETMEKQRSPIELDSEDLKKFLSLVEDLPSEDGAEGRPQILISNFTLSKKGTILQNEVFEMKMDFLKREFIAP